MNGLRRLVASIRWPRHVRPVARVEGWLSRNEAMLLFELARAVRDGAIVEVGSYRGRSTVALALGSAAGEAAPVYAIDPHEEFVGEYGGVFGPDDRAAFYRAMLRTGCYRNVRLVNLSSEHVVQGWDQPIGLLWLDGDHRVESVRRDVQLWRRHLPEGSRLALDDVTPGSGPDVVLGELVADGSFEVERRVGKVGVLRRSRHPRPAAASDDP